MSRGNHKGSTKTGRKPVKKGPKSVKIFFKKAPLISATTKARTLTAADIKVSAVGFHKFTSALVSGRRWGGLGFRNQDADRKDPIIFGDVDDQGTDVKIIDMDTADIGPHVR